MNVTGYLALYTTILGWQQYQNLWGIMTATGLVYIPFIGIILNATVEPFLSMGAKDFSIIAVRRLIVRILSALFIIAICCVPSVSLSPKVLHFQPTCQSQAQDATPGNTGTTYDNAFNVPTSVKIPLVWYLVMAVSNGFTYAANVGLSCEPVNYRQLHAELSTTTIQDPALKQEVISFYQQCYVPAYSRYLNLNNQASENQQSQIATIENQYGKDDTGWMGSQVLLTVPGFYDSIQASNPINGFPFDSGRDQIEGQVQNHSEWGEPYCSQWWSDPTNGLHAKLMQQFSPSFINSLLHFGEGALELEDAAIRDLIAPEIHDSSADEFSRGYDSLNNDDSFSSNFFINHMFADTGVLLNSVAGFTTVHLIINALPVIQAAILFCFYAFLAIAIPFSGYKPSFIVTASIVLFAVIFCSYLWHLVAWFDNQLITALFGDHTLMGSMRFVFGPGAYSWVTSEIFVNLLIGGMYLVLPIFFLSVLSWAGLQAGSAFGSMLNSMSAPSSSAGQAAGQAVNRVATTAVNTRVVGGSS